ncbi:MAG TPA: hypothetical protein VLS49_06735 [Usitatibacter sp.]|nr:hypothetical protein [Usitatibacter sp.]
MDVITPIAAFEVPLGGQKIELQEVRFAAGGIPLLRVRIREGSRYTVFDVDARTAAAWGRAMQEWVHERAQEDA